MKEFFDHSFEEPTHKKDLVERYERMIQEGQLYFFDVEEFEELIDHYLDTQNNKKAQEVLSMAKSQHPSTTDLLLREAELLAASDKHKKAIEIIEQLELLERSNTELLIVKAAIYGQQGDTSKAIDILKYAIQFASKSELEDIYQNLSFELQTLEKFDEAIDFLKKVLDLNHNNEDALYEISYCFENADNDIEGAEFFERYINNHPYSYHAWYNLGTIFMRLGLYEKAEQSFDYAIVIKEEFPSAYFYMASAQAKQERFKDAIETYKASLQYEIIDTVTHFYIADCYEKLDQYKQAEKHYRAALDSDPQMATAWLGIAIALDHQNMTFESLHYIKKAIELEKNNPDYWFVLGEIQEKVGFIEEAAEAYEQVINLEYKDIDIWLDYSKMLFENGLIDEANEVVERAMEKHPDRSEIYYRFVAYLLKNGQLNDAFDFLRKALSMNVDLSSELLEYYPESKSINGVLELIDTYKTR